MTSADFRFSPRENRAHEIAWMSWGAPAFERARAEDKPILLSISAVWCHWCHVMDETSYSDANVIAAINERYVPVRVDNDRRPDVNARYNMGGWPTTAFLTPDGTPLSGATYLPPPQMLRALDEIARFYAERKPEIAQRTLELRERRANHAHVPDRDDAIDDSAIAQIVDELDRAFDDEYAGFGSEPKFPQPELLEFLLAEWRVQGNQRLYEMAARTMRAMAGGGMYDHAEGGFFRYSTTRDWSVPHFEKMAEDHAGLIRVLAALATLPSADEFHATLVSACGYVRTVLRDPQTGLFAGSQDADEAYYALGLEERRARQAPYVDRTSYTNWTCALAGAGCLAGRTLANDGIVARALDTLDTVWRTLLDDDGLAYHVLIPGQSPQVHGLLTDQVALLRALLDAHEVSGEARCLERAQVLAQAIVRFEAPDGGAYDRLAQAEPSLGRLDVPDRPLVDNGLLAEALLRLSALTGDPAYRARARRTLAAHVGSYASAGSFAATYARALRRYLQPECTVRVVGTPEQTGAFRDAASRLPAPFTAIRTLDAAGAAAFGLPHHPQPVAYVCGSDACGAPVHDPGELRSAYDALFGR